MMGVRRALVVSFCTLLVGCYPPQPVAPVAVAPAPVVLPPAEKAAAAATVIQKTVHDEEVRVKIMALMVYNRLVQVVRQGKVSTQQYATAQKAWDDLQTQLHAASVLSPLGQKPAEDAMLSVAKSLAYFLDLARKAGAL